MNPSTENLSKKETKIPLGIVLYITIIGGGFFIYGLWDILHWRFGF